MNDYSPTTATAETVVAITGRTTLKFKCIYIYFNICIYIHKYIRIYIYI